MSNSAFILQFECGPIYNPDKTISLHATAEGAQRKGIKLFRRYARELLNKFPKEFNEMLREVSESLPLVNENTTDLELYNLFIDTDDSNGVEATFDGLLELLTGVCWKTTKQCRHCNKNEYTLEIVIYKDTINE